MSGYKKIGNKLGLSETETKVLLFVSASLFVGIFAYYFKYKNELVPYKHYDYSVQNYLFKNSSFPDNKQKRVDYKQELYDFSDNKLESVGTIVNINTASVKKLILLPGIGKKTAEKIIEYRKIHGDFKKSSDLLKVKGIGKKKFKKIEKFLIVK